MPSDLSADEQSLLDRALAAASDTKFLTVGRGAVHDAASVFASAFGDVPAMIVADGATYAAAGADVHESLRRADIVCEPSFIFPPEVYAEHSFVELLENAVGTNRAILVAVGSGAINDLTKLVAHRLGRPYMVVATAASMDGYTAYGASITYRGSKQTFDCPAPVAVVADLDVIARAPRGMNASGYADLFAKGVAGADWILAEAAGEEPIDPPVWSTVQDCLPEWIDSPSGVANAEPACLSRLVVGLMMSGFAMQAARTSRPASGAEHQFSHLWDMQHHTHDGVAPSHGFKVGIGTLASLDLYEVLLSQDLKRIDIDAAVSNWPSARQFEDRIRSLLGEGELAEKALEETAAKLITPTALREQLQSIIGQWPRLRDRLVNHLLPFRPAREMLREAGCPFKSEQIGIPRERLLQSYEQAFYIRRRFTVLDFAMRFGLFERAMHELSGSTADGSRKGC